MSLLFTTVPAKRLSRTLLVAGSAIFLENIKGWNDEDLTAADFGTQLYAVLRDAGNTVMELMEVDPSTVESDNGISIIKRGLAFTGDRTTELAARKLNWTKNTTIVELGSCSPQDLQYLKDYIDDIAISGSPNASTTAKGIVEVATTAEIDADTSLGATGASLSVRPDQLVLSKYGTRLPSANEKSALAGNVAPSATSKFITQDGSFSGTADQSQTTRDSGSAVGEANATTKKNKLGQSFTAARTKIRGVELYKDADTGTFTGTVKVALQADSAGSPSGSDLASITITNAVWLLITAGAFQVDFSAEYAMTPGTLYHIVVTPSTSDNSNHPNLGVNSAGGYASGSLKYNNTADGWVGTSTDLYFKTLNGLDSQGVITDSVSGLVPSEVLPAGLVTFDTTVVSGASSTTETTLWTKLLPSGVFRLNSGIKVKLVITADFTNNGAGETKTIKVKLNGTTVVTLVTGTVDDEDAMKMLVEALILNNASLSAQKYMASLHGIAGSGGVVAGTGSGTFGLVTGAVAGTAAVDTSGPVILTVTIQNSSNQVDSTFAGVGMVVERIA